MKTVSNICFWIATISMLAMLVLFVIWCVKKLRKKLAKKAGGTTIVCLACFVVFFFAGAFTSPAMQCNHEYELIESKAAACEKDGYRKYHCDLCGAEKTEKVKKLGHDMVDGVCSRCGYAETEKLKTEEIQTEKPVETEEEYKAECKKIDWKDLCRYPDDYKGQKICVEVKIQQIMSSKRWRAQSDNDGTGWYMDDEYYLVDKRSSDAVKILEDDVIVVYGEFTGIETITRALTWTNSEIPRINVKYADLVEWQTCEEIYEEYAQKMRDAVPTLIEEFLKEAETNTDGITGLAEISNNKISALADIESNGTQKMASTYSNAGENYDDYTEWAGKLWDVYMEEASKIQDTYMNSALG